MIAPRHHVQPAVAVALDKFFESFYRLHPVDATFVGVHDHDTELPDWTPSGLARATDEMRALERELAACEASAGPGDDTMPRVDLALARSYLLIQLAELESPNFQRGNPALYTGEALFGVLGLMLRDFAPVPVRVAAIADRLLQVPTFLAGGMATIHKHPVPRLWFSRAIRECRAAERLLLDGLPIWCQGQALDQTQWEHLHAAARAALVGFATFGEWLSDRMPAQPGAGSCGADLFQLLMRRGHWEERRLEILLERALQELDQESARFDELARHTAPAGWHGVKATLAARHPPVEHYVEAFHTQWNAARALVEEQGLVTWPSYPIRYVPIPGWARAVAASTYFLHYRAPARFDPVDVVEYLVPPVDDAKDRADLDRRLQATNDAVIKLNHVVHHGGLGHHVQNYYAYRAASRIGQVAAVDGASRIAMFLGGTMAEGWACYATDLMEEAGFLTPLERVAQQHHRVKQLTRAVVDISIHVGAMTEADATRFHVERSDMTREAARLEVTRTTMFPGTAIMYWLGTNGIHRIRAERSSAAGGRFSLRHFHDQLLSFGSLPVPVIGELLRSEPPGT